VKDMLSITWFAAKAGMFRAAKKFHSVGTDVSVTLKQSMVYYERALCAVPALGELHHEMALAHYALFLQV
jgi:hypothetical protein